MNLRYIRPERLNLKTTPEFNEAWLQQRIVEDTTILGLGDLDVIARERIQSKAGRLDLLLADADGNRRYAVELMLGATDPSHVVRTIEYWDIERRRYPAYDHVAVLVAEDITSRFLNVLSLLAGSIPLIAIQLNALKVDDGIVLDFVRVLDQTELRVDDEATTDSPPADRQHWETRVGPEVLRLIDAILETINEKAGRKQNLTYNKQFIGLNDGTKANNFVVFHPRKKHVRAAVSVSDAHEWVRRLEDAGLNASIGRSGRVRVNVTRAELDRSREVLRELFQGSVIDYQS